MNPVEPNVVYAPSQDWSQAEIERLRATNERLAIQNERMRAALIAYRHATSNTTYPSTHPIWRAFRLDDAARAALAEQEVKT